MADHLKPSPSPNIPNKRPKVTKDQTAPDPGLASQEPHPPTFIRKLRKAAVGTGCDIRLRVSVTGFPKPSLAWYHNDDLLPPSEAHDSGGLWIRDCHTSDAGLYTCVATNQSGEASCSAVLAIMDLGEGNQRHKLKKKCEFTLGGKAQRYPNPVLWRLRSSGVSFLPGRHLRSPGSTLSCWIRTLIGLGWVQHVHYSWLLKHCWWQYKL